MEHAGFRYNTLKTNKTAQKRHSLVVEGASITVLRGLACF